MALFDNLEWKLTAEDKASGTFNKVAVSADNVADSSGRMEASLNSANGSWLNIAKGVLGGLVSFEAASAAFGFLTTQISMGVQEAIEAQSEIERLTALTQNATGATQAQVDALIAQADAMEAVGVVSAGAIITAQGQLATFDLTTEAIQNLIPSLVDMSVAEYGARVSADQLKSAANGLGKALQGQTDLLTKMGFQFDEATKSILENGTEQERVAAITEILDSTYAGLNETMAETAEGRLIRLEQAFGKVREQLGLALIPTLSILSEEIVDASGNVMVTDDTMKLWQRRIFETVGGLKTWIVIAGGFIGVVGAIGNVFIQASHVVMGVMVDWVKGILNLRNHASTAFGAIKQALTGDFMGAFNTLKNGITTVFSTTGREIGDFDDAIQGVGTSITSGMENAKNAVLKFHEQRMKFDEVADTMNNAAGAGAGLGSGLSDAADEAAKGAEKIQKSINDMSEDYEKAREDVATELMKLEESHAKEVDKIKEKLESLQVTLQETTLAYQQAMGEMNKTEAERVVEQEQNIADLKEQIAELRASGGEEGLNEDDNKQLQMLESQLAQETAAYSAYIAEREGLDAELEEARRRASLTEFERFIEDLNLKRAEEQSAYDAKLAEIQGEVLAQEQALAEENAVYEAKKAMYAEVDAAFQAFHDSYLANMGDMRDYTAESVAVMEAELKRIAALFSQIKDLRASASLQGVDLGSPGQGLGTEQSAESTVQGDTVTNQVTNNITIQVQGDQATAATLVAEIQRQLELAGLSSS